MKFWLLQTTLGRFARRLSAIGLWGLLVAAHFVLGRHEESNTPLSLLILFLLAQVLSGLIANLAASYIWDQKRTKDWLARDRTGNHDVSTIALYAILATTARTVDCSALNFRQRIRLLFWSRQLQTKWKAICESAQNSASLAPFGDDSTSRMISGDITTLEKSAAVALLDATGLAQGDDLRGPLIRAIVGNYVPLLREELKQDEPRGLRGWIGTEIQLWSGLFARLRQLEASIDRVGARIELVIPTETTAGVLGRFHFRNRRVKRLIGRTNELARLREFLAQPTKFSWWAITGAGGVGKSRLALELCLESRTDWECGFVDLQTQFDWARWDPRRPTLMIVDYALSGSRSSWLEIIKSLADRDQAYSHAVRIILLDRPQALSIWKQRTWTSSELLYLTFYGVDPKKQWDLDQRTLELEGLEDEELWSLITCVFDDCVRASGAPSRIDPSSKSSLLSSYRKVDPLGRPLFATMAAEMLASAGRIDALELRDLNDWVLRRIVAKWAESGVDDQHLRLLALATMIEGIQLDSHCDSIKQGVNPLTFPTEWSDVACVHMSAVSGSYDLSSAFLAPLEPDPLGEALVLWLVGGESCETDGNRVARRKLALEVVRVAEDLRPDAFNRFMWRLSGDYPESISAFTSVRALNLYGAPIVSVAPLASLHELEELNLGDTFVSSLAPLAGLRAIRALGIQGTEINDITPIARWAALEDLDIADTNVTDISVLSTMTHLRALDLSLTPVKNLAPLAVLTNLEYLDAHGSAVEALWPEGGAPSLQYVNLSSTAIDSVRSLRSLFGLQYLAIAQTAVADLEPISRLRKLWVLDASDTEVSELAPLDHANLEELLIAGTAVRDLTPLYGMERLRLVDFTSTRVREAYKLTDLPNLTIMTPEMNRFSVHRGPAHIGDILRDVCRGLDSGSPACQPREGAWPTRVTCYEEWQGVRDRHGRYPTMGLVQLRLFTDA